MSHRHEWTWIGTQPEQGERCRGCGKTRDVQEPSHRWSGWPGAWCLDCGAEDADELDLAGPPDKVHHRYSKTPHTAQPCAGCGSGICPTPGSKAHDPYARADAVGGSR